MEKMDNTGWWNHTRWLEHFGDRHLGNIAHASRLPDRQERELLDAKRIIISMLKSAVDGLSLLYDTRQTGYRQPIPLIEWKIDPWFDYRIWRAWIPTSTIGFDLCVIACECVRHSESWRKRKRGGDRYVPYL